ncbi:MAG: hypothetical protein WCA27_10500 [Candidatus Sulfotelmatobacter sp.]
MIEVGILVPIEGVANRQNLALREVVVDADGCIVAGRLRWACGSDGRVTSVTRQPRWRNKPRIGGSPVTLPTSLIAAGSINYSVSTDGRQVAFARKNGVGISHLWLGTTDHRSSPHEIPSAANEDSPYFLPDGDLIFREREGGLNFVYRMKPDGTARSKVVGSPIFELRSVSPDGRWVVAHVKSPDEEHPYSVVAYPIDGGEPVQLCYSLCTGNWSTSGLFFYLQVPPTGDLNTYMLPLRPGRTLPTSPPGGLGRVEFLKKYAGALAIPQSVDSAVSPSHYSYTKGSTRRNIYRIPLS